MLCNGGRCWNTLGLAICMGQIIGLHIESSSCYNPKWMGDSVSRDHRQTWYSMYVLGRLLALQFGRPMAIHEADFNVELPSYHDQSAFRVQSDGVLLRTTIPHRMVQCWTTFWEWSISPVLWAWTLVSYISPLRLTYLPMEYSITLPCSTNACPNGRQASCGMIWDTPWRNPYLSNSMIVSKLFFFSNITNIDAAQHASSPRSTTFVHLPAAFSCVCLYFRWTTNLSWAFFFKINNASPRQSGSTSLKLSRPFSCLTMLLMSEAWSMIFLGGRSLPKKIRNFQWFLFSYPNLIHSVQLFLFMILCTEYAFKCWTKGKLTRVIVLYPRQGNHNNLIMLHWLLPSIFHSYLL